ncbi:MAG: toprim domain-containing protein, partial [Allobaculum sp.]|nr:toprim domain-containing protein [Allobaculum sp.]
PGLPVVPFNLPALKSLANGSKVYIAEGVTDCLALLSEGYNAIAIPGANNYKEEFAKFIDRFFLVMFPDRDSAGTGLYNRISKSLKCSIFRQEIPENCKDYSDYHILKHE